MSFTGKTSKPAKDYDRHTTRKLPLWLRVSAWVVTLALAGSISLGVPLHSNSGCSVPEMEMSACEHVGVKASTLEGKPLCCVLESQEPAPLVSASKIRVPTCSSDFLDAVALPSQLKLPQPFPQLRFLQNGSFTPPHTYLKNHALLI